MPSYQGYALLALLMLLAACGRSLEPAPVIQVEHAAQPLNGQTVTVSPGDTVYAIAQRFQLSSRDIIDANGLTAPFTLRVGQRLVLPTPETYVVKRGDTLRGLARQYNVDVTELARANNIGMPFVIQEGQTLRIAGGRYLAAVPSAPTSAAEAPPSRQTSRSSAIEQVPLPPVVAHTPAAPVPLPAPPPSIGTAPHASRPPTQLAPPTPTAPPADRPPPEETPPTAAVPPVARYSDAPPSTPAPLPQQATATDGARAKAASTPPPAPGDTPARSRSRLAWPVRGDIISEFGPRPDGSHNDGINVAAAAGTPVLAAENGVVRYVGNTVPGYGNLILIRHAGGTVTAYAHLGEILVKPDQTVARDQKIGTVGQTGAVTRPQLHFEVRAGTRAINPLDQLDADRRFRRSVANE